MRPEVRGARLAPQHVQNAADGVQARLGWQGPENRSVIIQVISALDSMHLLLGSPNEPEPDADELTEAARLLAGYHPRYGPDCRYGWQDIAAHRDHLAHAYAAAVRGARTVREHDAITRAYETLNRAQRRV